MFESEIVQREVESMMQDWEVLNGLMEQYHDFDLEGKKVFLEKFTELEGRFSILKKRFELSSNPEDKALLNNPDFFLSSDTGGWTKLLAEMRSELQDEEEGRAPSSNQFASQVFSAAANLEDSSLSSDMVKEDLRRLMREFAMLMSLSEKFPSFDLEVKRIYLSKALDNLDRLRIFRKRFELSNNPADKRLLASMYNQFGGVVFETMIKALENLSEKLLEKIKVRADRE
eukprot:gene13221-15623_t